MKTWFGNLFILPTFVLALLLLLAATMASQAAVTAPTLTITAPKANEMWSNVDFTVTGTVTKGTAAISNVLISLNGGISTTATLSGTKWTNVVALTPGTNTISAFAQDTNGLPSKTNTVKLIYIPSARLTLSIVGPGSVSPDDTNALLALGVNYTLKATAAKGFGFNFWNVGDVTSSNPTLIFTMQSGLDITANFKDITPPTIAITAPKANEQWSNEDFTVTGTAKDNVTISNVNVSVNGGAWTTATLSASGTAWTNVVTLAPGNNTIAAYAVGAGDLSSTTNTVNLVYVPSARLTLNIVGKGTVSPDDTNALLAIGHIYTLKATAASGFGFYFWNVGASMTNSATLNFTMENNLVITANFKDITPPTLTITSPKSGAHLSNAVVQVSGTASDNVAVVAVQARINGGDWVTATGTSNWTVSLPVVTSSNIIQATAEDAAGNFSKTNTVSFIGFPPSQIAWAPTSLSNALITMTPISSFFPTAPHALSLSASSFSYSETNAFYTNWGIGQYSFIPVDTNYSVVELSFTAPTTVAYPNVVLDLAFDDYDTGFYTNEASGEFGSFTIQQPQPQLAPTSWSGKSYALTPQGSTKSYTVSFTSNSNVTTTDSDGSTSTGTYEVNNASPIAAFFVVTPAGGTEPEQRLALTTFTSTSGGYYEIEYYVDGVMDAYEIGNFVVK